MRRINDYLLLSFLAFLGSILELLFLLISNQYWYYLIGSACIVLPVVTAVAFRVKNAKDFMTCYCLCVLYTVLLCGMAEAIENVTGISRLPFLFLVTIGLGVGVCMRRIFRYRKLSQKTISVVLKKGTKEVTTVGYYDSGNFLKEPYQRRAVHIISPEIAKELGLAGCNYNPLVIPYTSLGNTGLLSIYTIDSLVVGEENEQKQIQPAVVGIADAELMRNKTYNIILNQEVDIE